MTLKIRNEETGEVMEIESPAYKGIPDGDDFDFSSTEGILTPFDKLEGTLLEASRRTLCVATEQFMLREYSKKKEEYTGKIRLIEAESLIGRPKVIVCGNLCDKLNSKERLVSYRVTRLMIGYNANASYRVNIDTLNAALFRSDDELIAYKTTQEYMIRLGTKVYAQMNNMAAAILAKNGFDPETLLPKDGTVLPDEIKRSSGVRLSADDPLVISKISDYNKGKSADKQIPADKLPVLLSAMEASSKNAVYVSFDDVCVGEQKTTHKTKQKDAAGQKDAEKVIKTDQNKEILEHFYSEYAEADESANLEEDAKEADETAKEAEEVQCKEDAQKERKNQSKGTKNKGKGKGKKNGKGKRRSKTKTRVWHTTAQVIVGETGRIYRFHGQGKEAVFRQVLAFLIENHLLENHDLIFNTDGAEDIRKCIEKYFGFRSYTIVLDWYHVKKKTSQYISLAFGGKISDKTEIKDNLFPLLWLGKVDDAIEQLKGIDPKMVKDQGRFDDLIGYLERKKPFLACYALRKLFGLKNSSQFVEKTNDLLVSSRQKHNGMSWSWKGSHAIAALRTLEINKGLTCYGTVRKLLPHSCGPTRGSLHLPRRSPHPNSSKMQSPQDRA